MGFNPTLARFFFFITFTHICDAFNILKLTEARPPLCILYSTAEDSSTVAPYSVDPKEAVKIFGRLAEKYILLDETAGMCCYSACKDCEYRLPGGGYRMADQTAARPKWIPSYIRRTVPNEHSTKWSSELFGDDSTISKECFVQRLLELDYLPPLGGPYVGASAAEPSTSDAAEKLFDVLSQGKNKLEKLDMSTRLKDLAGGEEGLTWAMFLDALNS